MVTIYGPFSPIASQCHFERAFWKSQRAGSPPPRGISVVPNLVCWQEVHVKLVVKTTCVDHIRPSDCRRYATHPAAWVAYSRCQSVPRTPKPCNANKTLPYPSCFAHSPIMPPVSIDGGIGRTSSVKWAAFERLPTAKVASDAKCLLDMVCDHSRSLRQIWNY